MMLIICMLIGFCFFLLERVWELKKQVADMGKILKSMNDDLNMVSKTMDNMYRDQQGAKQILKG